MTENNDVYDWWLRLENNDIYDWWLGLKNNDVLIDDESSKITILDFQNSDRWK